MKTFNKACTLHCGLEFYVILPKVNRVVNEVIFTMLKIVSTVNRIHSQALDRYFFLNINRLIYKLLT